MAVTGRDLGAGQFAGSREKLLKASEVSAGDPGGHAAGPPRDHGHTDSTLVEIAFAAAQRAIGVEEVDLVAAFLGAVPCHS